jgi:DNA primase
MADQVDKPYRFLSLDKPGVTLLAELLDLARARPGINPAMLLQHFAERPEYAALEKLMTAMVVGDAEAQRTEFFEALRRMEEQAITLRRAALHAKMSHGPLADDEKTELRALLAARVRAPVAPP